MAEENKFEMILKGACELPMVHIDRESFLKKELSKYCSQDIVELAVCTNPAQAGISLEIIDKIAKSCINYETNKVSAISFAAGIPGGYAIIGTLPADLTQFFAHVVRVMQKLMFLYGWGPLDISRNGLDDDTQNVLTIFAGVMFGVNGAEKALAHVSNTLAANVAKKLPQKALTKGVIYPIVKKIANKLGIEMTKEIFAKSVAKIIPVVGGVLSGGLTYASFKPMANRLRKHLAASPLCDVEYYRNIEKNVETEYVSAEYVETN